MISRSIDYCKECCLRALSTDTTGELDILGHDSNTLGMDSTQVGIFEKTNKVGFGSFLQSKNGRSLEAKIRLEVLGNLTDQTLERKLADEKVGTLLVTTDLTKGDSSGTVTVGLLDSSSGRGRLTGSLQNKSRKSMALVVRRSVSQVSTLYHSLFLLTLVANCLRGAFPPVDLRAVCLVRAILIVDVENLVVNREDCENLPSLTLLRLFESKAHFFRFAAKWSCLRPVRPNQLSIEPKHLPGSNLGSKASIAQCR